MSRGERAVATASQTIGPFFHFGLTAEPHGRMADRLEGGGDVITLRLSVRDGDGAPVIDAMIEFCQAGVVGRMPTDADGTCEFQTHRPVPPASGGAAHIEVQVFARGLLRQLHTRIYFDGDPGLDEDAVLALVPPDRRDTLLAKPGEASGAWTFDVRLQGERETVFFDL